MDDLPEWDDMTEGQKRLASAHERGEYSALATLALVGMVITPPLIWLMGGDWLHYAGCVWFIALFACIGLMQSETKGVLAARYRRWLMVYQADMRRTGRYDRGEPY